MCEHTKPIQQHALPCLRCPIRRHQSSLWRIALWTFLGLGTVRVNAISFPLVLSLSLKAALASSTQVPTTWAPSTPAPSAPGIGTQVDCFINADNVIDQIFINGQAINLTGVQSLNDWSVTKKFDFLIPAQDVRIAVVASESVPPGSCIQSEFWINCNSPNTMNQRFKALNQKSQGWRGLGFSNYSSGTAEQDPLMNNGWASQYGNFTAPTSAPVTQQGYVFQTPCDSTSPATCSLCPDQPQGIWIAGATNAIFVYDISLTSTTSPTTISTFSPTTGSPSTLAPSTQQPSTQQPSTQQPSTQLPSSGSPSTLEPSTQQPSTQQPFSQQPSSQQPSTQQPSTQQPSTQQPSTQQPSTQQPSTQQPSTQQPSTQLPSSGSPFTLEPSTQQPSTQQPSTQQPSSQQPSTQQPSSQQPSSQQPSTQQPFTQQPSTQQPSTQLPSSGSPFTLGPSTLQPSTQQPSTQQPSTQQPSTHQPSTKQPSTEQPSTQLPSLGPSTQQPFTQQPSTQQPSTQQPSTLQPSTQLPSSVSPVTPEPTVTTLMPSLTPTVTPTNSPTGGPTRPCTPPALVSTSLQDDGGSIQLKFSTATNVPQGSCLALLSLSTVESLGTDPKCTWLQPELLSISLASDATIVPGNNLTVQGNIIRRSSLECIGSFFPKTTDILLPPVSPSPVKAVITSPLSYATCASIRLDAIASTGASGRPFEYKWKLERVINSSTANSSALLNLQSNVISQTGSALVLTASQISSVTQSFRNFFIYNLTVENWLQAKDSTVIIIESLPAARGIPPAVTIDGSTSVTVDPSLSVYITTSVNTPKTTSICSVQGDIVYSWRSLDGFDSLIESPSKSFLFISGGVLNSSTKYQFELETRFQGESVESKTFVDVTVIPGTPIPVIKQCNRAVDTKSQVVIDGFSSFAPDNITAKGANLNYIWSCTRLFSDGSTGSCGISTLLAASQGNPSLVIPPNVLTPTNTTSTGIRLATPSESPYSFKMSVSNPVGNFSSSDTCLIWVRNTTVSLVYVTSVTQASGKTTIETDPFSIDRPRSYLWTCRFPDGVPCSPSWEDAVLGDIRSRNIVLRNERLISGSTYEFSVLVSSPYNASGSAIARTTMPTGPSSGSCFVTPTIATQAAETGDLALLAESIDNSLGILRSGSTNDASRGETLVAAATVAVETAPDTTDTVVQKTDLLKKASESVIESTGTISEGSANKTVKAIQKVISSIGNNDVKYTDSFGRSATSALSTLFNSSRSSAGVADEVSNAMDNLGQAMGSSVTEGQAPLTAASEGVRISVQKFDWETATAASQNGMVTIQHAGGSSESAVVPLEIFRILAEEVSRVSVLGSVSQYLPPPNTTQIGNIVSLSLFNGSEEVDVTGVEEGILISINSARNRSVFSSTPSSTSAPTTPDGLDGACQFFQEGQWIPDGCTLAGFNDDSGYICNCTHLTSFTVVEEKPTPSAFSAQDIRNLNLKNLGRNPFTLIALMVIALLYLGVVVASKRYRRERVCPLYYPYTKQEKKLWSNQGEEDFLMQWYFQLPLMSKQAWFEPEENDTQELEATGLFYPAKLARLYGEWQARAHEAKHEDENKTPPRINYTYRINLMCGLKCCKRQETESERVLRIMNERKGKVIDRVRRVLRRTGGKESEIILRESERRERRFLFYAASQTNLNNNTSAYERRRLSTLVEIAARQRRRRRKIWQLHRPVIRARMFNLWWKFTQAAHEWIGIFHHRKLDPFTSLWRANVLLMSLLLVLMVNGCFYVTDRTNERPFIDEIYISTVTAIVVAILGYSVSFIAKKIGYLKWEYHLIRVRNRLCVVSAVLSSDEIRLAQMRALTSEWMLNIAGEGALGDIRRSSNTLSIQLKLQFYRILAWVIFIVAAGGSALTVLVLGVKFDLEDEEGGNNTAWEIYKSASFRWLYSVILSEMIMAAVVSPCTLLGQTLILFIGMEFCSKLILDLIIDDDAVLATMAFDVYAKVVRGYRLSPLAFQRLKRIVKRERKTVLKGFGSTMSKDAALPGRIAAGHVGELSEHRRRQTKSRSRGLFGSRRGSRADRAKISSPRCMEIHRGNRPVTPSYIETPRGNRQATSPILNRNIAHLRENMSNPVCESTITDIQAESAISGSAIQRSELGLLKVTGETESYMGDHVREHSDSSHDDSDNELPIPPLVSQFRYKVLPRSTGDTKSRIDKKMDLKLSRSDGKEDASGHLATVKPTEKSGSRSKDSKFQVDDEKEKEVDVLDTKGEEESGHLAKVKPNEKANQEEKLNANPNDKTAEEENVQIAEGQAELENAIREEQEYVEKIETSDCEDSKKLQ
ncbi:hypothetical protein AAMO2058_001416000 [Amorphochlora amoebiformis]